MTNNYLDRINLAKAKEDAVKNLAEKKELETREKEVYELLEKLKPYCLKVCKILDIVRALDKNGWWSFGSFQKKNFDLGDIFIEGNCLSVTTDRQISFGISSKSIFLEIEDPYRLLTIEEIVKDKVNSKIFIAEGKNFLKNFDDFEKFFYSSLEEFLVSKGA